MATDRGRLRAELAERIRAIRRGTFGDDVSRLADALEVPERTWLNYEAGVVMPDETMLRFLVLTGARAEWLLTGRGPCSGGILATN